MTPRTFTRQEMYDLVWSKPMTQLAGYLSIIDNVQIFATQLMYKFNHQLPNMALGGFAPIQRLAMAA